MKSFFKFQLVGLSLVVLLQACALTSNPALTTQQIAQLPQRHVIAQVPFIPQTQYQCGPASLAMVLNYYNDPISPQLLEPWVFSPKAKGSFPAELSAAARAQGFISYPVTQLHQILEEVSAGHPVLLQQNLGLGWYPLWHFAVAVGFDLERREILLHSGEHATLATPFKSFTTTWRRSGPWARVILPTTEKPTSATPLTYLQAALDLQKTGAPQAALDAYKTAVRTWPDNTTALFGLANQHYALNQFTAAQATYESLLTIDPSHNQGWNNYGYSLLQQGCQAQALQAIKCAAKLQPEDINIQQSLTEIANSPPTTANATCSKALDCDSQQNL